jgi:hypothetical protein
MRHDLVRTPPGCQGRIFLHRWSDFLGGRQRHTCCHTLLLQGDNLSLPLLILGLDV